MTSQLIRVQYKAGTPEFIRKEIEDLYGLASNQPGKNDWIYAGSGPNDFIYVSQTPKSQTRNLSKEPYVSAVSTFDI